MILPDSVIDQARDLNPLFTPEIHPKRTLRRELSRYQRQLLAKLLLSRKQDLFVLETISFPLATFEDGHTIASELLHVHGGDVWYDSDGNVKAELSIVPWEHRFGSMPWPAATWDGQVIYFLGVETDWSTVSQIVLRISTTPAAIDDPTVASSLPDYAEEVVVARLAYFMAKRTPEKVDVSIYRVDARDAEADFLRAASAKNRVVKSRVREVYPGTSAGGYLRSG